MSKEHPAPKTPLNLWHFIWISVVASELLVALLSTLQYALYIRTDLAQLLLVGAVDSLFVPLIIAPMVIYFTKKRVQLQKDNEQLQQEIAERKQAEDALQQSEERYRALIEASAQIVWTTNPRGEITDELSPGWQAYTGQRLDQKNGYAYVECFHPDDRAAVMERWKEGLQKGISVSAELRLRHHSGEWRWNHVRAVPLRDKSGTIVSWVGMYRDFHDRMQAQEALRLNEERLRVALSAANQGWYDLNVRTGEVIVSPEYPRLLGYDPREFVTSLQNWFDHIHPDDRSAVQKAFQDCLVSGGPAVMEYRRSTKSGDWIWLSSSGKIVEFDEDHKPLRMTGIHTNITERKQAERALQDKTRQLEDLTANLEKRVREEVAWRKKNEDMLVQQSKLAAMGEMLGAIAHQWRQPLNTLGLFIQDLKDSHAHGELDNQYLETAVQKSMVQIQHMSETIDDFRNFFRPDKDRSDFDTMQAVGHVLSLFSAQLAANDIDFRLTCHSHGKTFTKVEDIIACREKTIKGFQNEFEHVIMNMINNAREAIIERRESGPLPGDGHGIIIFDFRNVDNRVIVEVSNNGGTIPENILSRIFEPYFTTKDLAQGTGLGLYMSKVIIEEHMHGKLTAQNRDQGAVFTIELPMA